MIHQLSNCTVHMVKMGPLPLTTLAISVEMSRWAMVEVVKVAYKRLWKGDTETQENWEALGRRATNALVLTLVTRLKYGNVLALTGLLAINRWSDPGAAPKMPAAGEQGTYSKDSYIVRFLDKGISHLPSFKCPDPLFHIQRGSAGALSKIERFVRDCHIEMVQFAFLVVVGATLLHKVTGASHLSYGGYRLL